MNFLYHIEPFFHELFEIELDSRSIFNQDVTVRVIQIYIISDMLNPREERGEKLESQDNFVGQEHRLLKCS